MVDQIYHLACPASLILEISPSQEVCCSSQWDNDKIHCHIVSLAEKHESRDEIVHNIRNEKIHDQFCYGK